MAAKTSEFGFVECADLPALSYQTATAPVGGEATGAVKAGGSGYTEEGPGYPARRSKLKNQVRNNCPEAQCPEVQCPDCNSGGVMATYRQGVRP